MRALDLFCGAGGVSVGLERAGFEVTGVDIRPQPRYRGGTFIQADALTYPLDGYDFIWASPPCQRYMQSGMVRKDLAPDLVGIVRELLAGASAATVIENVPGAPLRRDLLLCGSMFGLALRRHRIFEASFPCSAPSTCDHSRPITGVYGHPHGRGGAWRNGNKPMLPSDMETWSREMGIDWMRPAEITQAIPPAYAEWIGRQALAALRQGAA